MARIVSSATTPYCSVSPALFVKYSIRNDSKYTSWSWYNEASSISTYAHCESRSFTSPRLPPSNTLRTIIFFPMWYLPQPHQELYIYIVSHSHIARWSYTVRWPLALFVCQWLIIEILFDISVRSGSSLYIGRLLVVLVVFARGWPPWPLWR